MNETVTATYTYLLATYGPLLTLKHMAEIMHSTPNGVRMAITRKRQPFAVALASARLRLGRRVYFEARRVAAVIDHGVSSTASVSRQHDRHHPTYLDDGAAAPKWSVRTRLGQTPDRAEIPARGG